MPTTISIEQKTFESKIIADSVNPDSQRITTYVLTYPRFIHSELMTHRVFSRNAASSRAIPIEKVISQVRSNPAMPVRWGKNGKGMQDHGVFSGQEADRAADCWISASSQALASAEVLNSAGLHKQIVNRVLEPFVWMTALVTATEWQNFFALRLHRDAQPEFQYLSYLMLKEYLRSSPAFKDWGEWHIPYGDRMPEGISDADKIKVATARAARVSYLTMDGAIDIAKDIALHDSLASSGHFSPFEHCASASQRYAGNFVGWNQYRKTLPNENKTCDLSSLLKEYEKSIGIE